MQSITAWPPTGTRTAMVFAHPAHEWFTLGALLRWQPDLYYLSRGAFTGPGFEAAFRQALADVGFTGSVTFAKVDESETYRRYLERDDAWFVRRRAELADWLAAVRPEVIFADPFEWYNSAHDLVPLLVEAALAAAQSPEDWLPELWEHGVAVHTIPVAMQATCRWSAAVCDDRELSAKRHLLLSMGDLIARTSEAVNDDLATVVSAWTPDQIRTERYRRVAAERDFTRPPRVEGWVSYDERGRRRVAAGRSKQAILFAEHFVPLAEALLPGHRSAARVA